MMAQKLRTRGKLSNTSGSKVDNVNADKLFEELKEKVKAQLISYREFWNNDQLNMVTILDEYGNERYKLDKKRNRINYTMITLVNDAAYVGKYFDVLGWWMANNHLYPELAVRACLVLGKPTHNGFQERVFSRGTYQDTKLKKRLKADDPGITRTTLLAIHALNEALADSALSPAHPPVFAYRSAPRVYDNLTTESALPEFSCVRINRA